ncbi:MAG: 2-dehydropantoate 2-reductase [Dethiosulfatibacter sp.]|nr:2-dehydropantoate 2-reductase [Dethiosulfatibacter sp.]
MRIAILGSGSIGTILGALLSKNQQDVVLIDSYKEHVDALNAKGAKIIGGINDVIPVNASLAKDLDGTFDLIFFTTKHMHMNDALESILANIKDTTIVVTLQNGIPEDFVCEKIGAEHVIGGSVGWGATFIEPGVSELTSDVSGMSVIIGELNGSITERVKIVASILELAGKVTISDNLIGTKWSKVIMNATSSGMSTVLGATFGEVADDMRSYTCEANIALEGAKVMSAAGITPVAIHGFLPNVETISFSTKSELEALHAYFSNRIALHRKLIASMLQDISKGRKTEINEINGKIVEYGLKFGIPTPFNEKVVQIVTKIQDGELKPDWSNINFFDLNVFS